MPFPVVKLAALVLKQGSKYVANIAKHRAKNSPKFTRMLVRGASYYHTFQTKLRMNLLGLGKVKEVQPLSEESAVQLGTEMIGDIVLITCGILIYLTVESSWWSSKKKDEGDKTEEEIESLRRAMAVQSIEVERLSAQLREIERILHSRTMYSDTSSKVIEKYKKELSQGNKS